ncbi:RNA polymerase II subunit A C-terminal domain phosphatase [Dipsacomyces acuminosporus]|nr:RNA polymerase II subunit A C-terminal domain phosphatase [Dipsacomyces acuminosporus]
MVKFAVICSSNMNRSMEAHFQLKNRGYNICSYGTGKSVRLPGPSADKPNIYNFGTHYNHIYNELSTMNNRLYTRNGLLRMLERNRGVKLAPQRFQDERNTFDIIFTCEERVFDAVCEELLNRGGLLSRPVHIINIEIKDNDEEAKKGGVTILELAAQIVNSSDLERDMDSIIESVQGRFPHKLLYTVAFY